MALQYWCDVSLQAFSTSRDDQNTTEMLAPHAQESPSSVSMADILATPILGTSCDEYMDMHCCSMMLHHETDLEQTSLLQPSVQPFVALMPTDSLTDANLSTGSAYGDRSDPGSGFIATDVHTFMQDSDLRLSSTAYTDHEPHIITSHTAPQISHSTSTIQPLIHNLEADSDWELYQHIVCSIKFITLPDGWLSNMWIQ